MQSKTSPKNSIRRESNGLKKTQRNTPEIQTKTQLLHTPDMSDRLIPQKNPKVS